MRFICARSASFAAHIAKVLFAACSRAAYIGIRSTRDASRTHAEGAARPTHSISKARKVAEQGMEA
eukprot:512308-Prymnesium_polylepis.1